MTAEQFEFVMAIQTYKKVNKRMYPTWTEILESSASSATAKSSQEHLPDRPRAGDV